MLTDVPLDNSESRVDRERTDDSDLLRWRARRLWTETTRGSRKLRPRRLCDGTQTLKSAFGDGHNTSDAEIRLWTYFHPTTA
jgi:hypothetical protein